MDEYNEMWMIVGTWWTQADMAESWWRSGGLHAQRDCGPYTHHDHLRPVHDVVSAAAAAGQDTPATLWVLVLSVSRVRTGTRAGATTTIIRRQRAAGHERISLS